MSLTAEEARKQAEAERKNLYNALFDKNIKKINDLIERQVSVGLFECKIRSRYDSIITFLEFPYVKDRDRMQAEIQEYYKGLGYIVGIEDDDYITIDWS